MRAREPRDGRKVPRGVSRRHRIPWADPYAPCNRISPVQAGVLPTQFLSQGVTQISDTLYRVRLRLQAALIASWAVATQLLTYSLLAGIGAAVLFACVYVGRQVSGAEQPRWALALSHCLSDPNSHCSVSDWYSPPQLDPLGQLALGFLALVAGLVVLGGWGALYKRAKQDLEAEAAKHEREKAATLTHGER